MLESSLRRFSCTHEVFQPEAVRFILEQRRLPFPTFVRRFHRTPRRLRRMAWELPCE
jgi:hypothetical protein